MDLYKDVRTRRSLWRAWTEVHSNAITSKAPQTREEARKFSREVPRHIDRISRALRQNRFIFAPQKGVLIQKSGGTKRPIVIAPIESRVVQRSLLDQVQRIPAILKTLTSGFNFGGVPGRQFGVSNAIFAAQAAMLDHPYFIRTDIKSFFDRVAKNVAVKNITAHSDDEQFNDLFRRAIDTEIADASHYGPDISLFPLFDEGVAQGSCLSPLLCNLLLAKFDLELNARGIRTIRYIDDILILARTEKSAFAAFDAGQAILKPFNLECYNPRRVEDRRKSEHGSISRGLIFLGCEITGIQSRPNAENRREILRRVAAHFEYSLEILRGRANKQKAHASYAETIVLVSKTVQGWANTFGFCTDERVMGSLDAEIDRLLSSYTSTVRHLLKSLSGPDRRRTLGVFCLSDRVRPVAARLLQSIQDNRGNS